MKKKIIIIVSILICLALLIPSPMKLKDGGTVVYQAVLYSITKVHSFNLESTTGYDEGIKINILGIEIYNNVHINK